MRFSLIVLLLALSYAAMSATVDQEDGYTVCDFKGDVAASVYLNRNKATVKTMLLAMKRDWDDHKADDWPYAAYVDSERIIRDAYRKSSDKCCTPEIAAWKGGTEIGRCRRQGW